MVIGPQFVVVFHLLEILRLSDVSRSLSMKKALERLVATTQELMMSGISSGIEAQRGYIFFMMFWNEMLIFCPDAWGADISGGQVLLTIVA